MYVVFRKDYGWWITNNPMAYSGLASIIKVKTRYAANKLLNGDPLRLFALSVIHTVISDQNPNPLMAFESEPYRYAEAIYRTVTL